MLSDAIPQLKTWSLTKKQQLIEELVNEVYGEPVQEPELLAALDARLKHFRKNPKSARVWTGPDEPTRRKK